MFILIFIGPLGVYLVRATNTDFLIFKNNKKTHVNDVENIKMDLKRTETIFDKEKVQKTMHNLFIENRGQLDKDVSFYCNINGFIVGFSTSKIFYYSSEETISVEFKESNIVIPNGKNQLPSFSNYYSGEKMFSAIKHYSSIVFENLYDNIDLVYYFTDQGLKYDFVLHPFSNLEDIIMIYSDLNDLVVEDESILITKDLMIVQDTNLKAWYDDSGEDIDIGFNSHQSNIQDPNSFEVKFIAGKNFDQSRRIIIDPLICIFSTFFGGSALENPTAGADNIEKDMITDEEGNIIIAGRTSSIDYPTSLPYQTTMNGVFDAVITKLTPDGKTILFSTYIGGNQHDWINCLAVDEDGNIGMVGVTESPDFPILNAIQDTYIGGTEDEPSDMFVAKMNENGTLLFSTYWGGSSPEGASGITFDSNGNIIICGNTASTDFYTKNAYQATVNSTDKCDTFITKFSGDGQSVIFSTFYGGDGYDVAREVIVDKNDNIIVAGSIQGTSFPTINAYQTEITGISAIIIMKFNPSGVPIFASTIDGNGMEGAFALTLDINNNFIIVGSTTSINYPLVNATQSTSGGSLDAFITKIAANGQSILFSTFLGGGGGDECRDIKLDLNGNYLVVGHTTSPDFPVTHGFQYNYSGNYDAFVTLIDRNSTLISSGFLGGNNQDQAIGVGVDTQNNIIVGGFTLSSDFPTYDAYQSIKAGYNDMFIAKFDLDLTLPDEETVPTPTESSEAGMLPLITFIGILSLLGSFVISLKKKKHS